jgi:hypothetical protein
MSDPRLDAIRDLIQEDINHRGLRTDPKENLITACANDFRNACRSLAEARNPAVILVAGFYIPHGQPPAGETDGPLGAVFLARALAPLGMRVVLISDLFCEQALTAGLSACSLSSPDCRVRTMPPPTHDWEAFLQFNWEDFLAELAAESASLHLIALERVGPSHTPGSVGVLPATIEQFVREVPVEHHDRCHTMRGIDVTAQVCPAHLLFEHVKGRTPPITTIGIGDGGNEIGMGKIPWEIIRTNIPNGGLIACRVPTDHLIVSGVSNWGAYGLAAGVYLLRGQKADPALFDPDRERSLLQVMVKQGPLVDGVTGMPTVSVDGLSFERYIQPLRRLGEICAGRAAV